MFGRGKSSDKSATKTKSRSNSSLPWKAWLLNHIEKIAMGLFVAFTGYLIYDGLTAGRYESSKSPDDLAVQAQSAKSEIETKDHWNEIKLDPERAMPNDFVKLVEDARKDMDASPYVIVNIPEKVLGVSGEKRGDPELFAPIEVQGNSFFGTIAVYSPKPSKADDLPNAPSVGDGKKPRKPPTATTKQRTLIPTYDVGFQLKPGATPPPATTAIPGRLVRPVENKVVPKLVHFNVVTAAVPHQMMADSYKKAFASATAYFPDRDSPNYISYEVQRVDVTSNPDRNIDETEWKEAPSCMLDTQLKEKSSWVGTCDEVALSNYVVDQILTMSIPPILLSDYRPLVSHPLVPRLDLVRKTSNAGDGTETMDDSPPTDDSSASDDSESVGGFPSASAAEDPKNIPKQLEVTDYKLLRFVDFDVKLDRAYRYRVRLVLEDPNYTRSKNFSPKTSDMKADVVARVQVLETADTEALTKLAPGKNPGRTSKRNTPWSEASSAIVTRKPVELYSSKSVGGWTTMKTPNGKSDVVVETIPLKATLVYAEWVNDLSLLVPHKKNDVERGTVLSGQPYMGSFPEPGLDAIHPVTKVIKWVKDFKFSDPVTVADIRGGQPLAAEKEKRSKDKDPLPAGGEVAAYDPRTGELVISREFESTIPFQMLGFTDEKPTDEGK